MSACHKCKHLVADLEHGYYGEWDLDLRCEKNRFHAEFNVFKTDDFRGWLSHGDDCPEFEPVEDAK